MIAGSLETRTDEELVAAFQEGLEPAFDHLVRRYQDKSIRLAFSMLRNWEEAKEVSQNAFVKTYFGLKNFKRESKFGTWFYRILTNQARDEMRRRMRAKQTVPVEEVLLSVFDPAASPSETVLMEDERRRIETAVGALPEKEMRIFVMKYFTDMPLQEIADVLGIALGTVKASLFHATEKVRRALAGAGLRPARTEGGQ